MSISMNFVNKYTLMVFPLPNIVMILQMLVTLAVLQPLQSLGCLDFPNFNLQR